MSHSFSQPTPLACPRCGASFQADLWLIVDAAERPDLLEKARQGSLHEVICPQCGHAFNADQPLLLYFPPNSPLPPGEGPGVRVIFSPAQTTTAKQDAEHARDLLARLKESLGPAWQDEWLENGLPGVPRALLPLALTEGLEAAQRKMVEQAQREIERLREEDPETYEKLEAAARQIAEVAPRFQTLQEFIQADTWADSRRILEQYPELLEERTDSLLEQLIQAVRAKGDQNAVRLLEEHRALLRRCREAGIPRAFAEKMLPPEALAAAEAAGLTPEQALEMARQAAQLPPELREILAELARRGAQIDNLEDVQNALERHSDLREKLVRVFQSMHSSSEVPTEFRQDIRLAQGSMQIYSRTGNLEALNQAANAWQRVLGYPTFGSNLERFELETRLEVLNDAGVVFQKRYWRIGKMQDLDFALKCWQQALQVIPPDHPGLPLLLTNLGNGLRDRYNRTDHLEDLEEALRFHRQAVDATPVDHPNLPAYLNNLGISLNAHYERTGRPENLEEALKACRQAVKATPSVHPNLPSRLTNLGNILCAYYKLSGRLEDLDEAIQVYRRAVASTPTDSPDQLSVLNNLGTGLNDRYRRTGRLEDLEEALSIFRQVVNVTPPGHPALPFRLHNLGAGLRDRYARTGRLEDLEEAIRVFREALAATPPDSPDRPSILNNLGAGLRDRYARTRRLEDLEEAIQAWQQALDATPPDSPDRPGYLTNLGVGLHGRYERTGRLEDLEETIRVWQQAAAATPPDSPDRPSILNNLGNGLSDRYARTRRLEDLEEAIRVFREALAATPPDSPDRPSILNNLGNGLRARYARTGRLEDLEEAIRVFREAVALGKQANPAKGLGAARNWLGWAFERRAWQEVEEAWQALLEVQQRRLLLQFDRRDKAFAIGETRGLAAQGAWAALQQGRLEQAVEALESGRAQLLREALERQRQDIHALAGGRYDESYQAYMRAIRQMDDLQNIPFAQRLPDWGMQVTQAAQALEQAIAGIQAIPGFEYFLRSLPFEQIQSLAQEAPLVYLAATDYGGFALIVQAAGVEVVELPGLTEETLQKQVLGFSAKEYQALEEQARKENRQPPSPAELLGGYLGAYWGWLANPKDETARQAWFDALEAMLGWLGQAVMGPLVARLETLGVPPGSVVRLIPGGWLGLLPLHAALTPGPSPAGRGEYALDHYTFTYLPSAQALYHARQQASRPADTLLLVDNPDETLVFSGQEARGVQDVFAKQATTTLKGARATKERVSQAMKAAGVLHFSTHGRAGWTESERAGLLLAKGEWLTLPEIFDLRLETPRLAVLSACETGVPGLKNPDEVEALPSGLMLAGVPGVVGSLWAVNDLSTALLMTWFYHFWRKEGLDLPQALLQAQRHLRDAYQSEAVRAELEALAGWRMSAEQAQGFVPLVTLRDFAHPYYWAGFMFTGL